ncbi:hypothetical protein KS4_03730 [Poriferisphaera corsica]|uniref:Prenyltransferase n=1 Tax=Poriferisphaera corsica TaxID=2528020 RepID=A0A517YQ56_9BACT|nr:YwiC-like family protein [Poriferisphaera corsica]QDU32341.1 hypothetical protein KS4_03730 [Poriferisphaera corsica]
MNTESRIKRIFPSRLRSVLLPAEHGAWAALIETILLGFLVSISWQSLVVAFNALLLGLCLQPTKIILRGATNKYQIGRYITAKNALKIIAPLGIALLSFNVIWPQISPGFALILLMGVPLVLVHWLYEISNKPRHLIAILAGMLSIAFIAPAMYSAKTAQPSFSLMILLVLCARQISSIGYARYLVRKSKNLPTSYKELLLLNVISYIAILLIAILPLTDARQIFIKVSIIFIALCLRTVIGVYIVHRRGSIKAKTIGMTELAIGITYVLFAALIIHNQI